MSTLAAGICPLLPDVSVCGGCFSRRPSCSCLLSAGGSLEPMSADMTATHPPGRKATVQVFLVNSTADEGMDKPTWAGVIRNDMQEGQGPKAENRQR